MNYVAIESDDEQHPERDEEMKALVKKRSWKELQERFKDLPPAQRDLAPAV